MKGHFALDMIKLYDLFRMKYGIPNHTYQQSLCPCPEVVEMAQSAEDIQKLDKKAWQVEVGMGADGSAGRNLSLQGCSDASFQPWQLVQPATKKNWHKHFKMWHQCACDWTNGNQKYSYACFLMYMNV